MAYEDINAWAQIIESQERDLMESEKKRAILKKEMHKADLDEFNNLDVDPIDFKTLGLTDSEIDDCIQEIEDENNDQINFDAYRLDEDGVCCICQRKYHGFGNNAEPVAFGKCCDACDQSVVTPARLQFSNDEAMSNGKYPGLTNEADLREPLTKAATKFGKAASTANLCTQDTVILNEDDDKEKILTRIANALEKIAGNKNSLTQMINDEPDDENELEDIDDTGLTKLTNKQLDDMMNEATIEDQLDQNILDKFSDIENKLESDEDFPMTDEEWEELDQFPNNTLEGLGQRWQYIWNKMKNPGISDTDRRRLSKLIDTYSDLMSDLAKKSHGFYGKTHPFKVKIPFVPKDTGRTAHHIGKGAEDREAETGLNSEYDISHANWTPEPMEAGTYATTQFNPEYRSIHDIVQDQKQILRSKAWKDAERSAMQSIKTKEGFRAAKELANQDEKVSISDFIKVLNGIPKIERDELMNDLIQNADSADEKRFIKTVFTNPNKIKLKDIGAAFGGGTRQNGETGMLTEWGDKMINLLLVILAEYWCVATNEAATLRKVMHSETTANREIRKQIRPVILGELMAELGDNSPVPQPYVQGIETRGRNKGKPGLVSNSKGKKAFDKKVGTILLKTLTDPHVSDEDREQISNAIANFKNNLQIRKIHSKFNPVTDNGLFQKLIAKARDNESDMTDDDWLQLFKLEGLRNGMSNETAQEAAEELLTNPDPLALKKLHLDDRIVKHFLRGGSGNANI